MDEGEEEEEGMRLGSRVSMMNLRMSMIRSHATLHPIRFATKRALDGSASESAFDLGLDLRLLRPCDHPRPVGLVHKSKPLIKASFIVS